MLENEDEIILHALFLTQNDIITKFTHQFDICPHTYIYIHIYKYISINIYIYTYICPICRSAPALSYLQNDIQIGASDAEAGIFV